LRKDAALFSFGTAVASALAWLVAHELHLGSSWWAAMTVFLVAQPTRGLVVRRLIHRVCGTLVGALVGAGVHLALGSHPRFEIMTLALWTGLCAAFGVRFGKSHRYAYVVSGLTAVVVAVSMELHPERASVVALERVGCTVIGALCALLAAVTLANRPHAPIAPSPTDMPPWFAFLRALLAVGLLGLAWRGFDWAGGPYAVMTAAVFVSVLSGNPLAPSLAPNVFIGATTAAGFGVIYRELVLRHLETMPAILLATWPVLLIGAWMSQQPRPAWRALDLNMIFLLAVQPGAAMSASSTVADSATGVFAGGLVTALLFRIPAPHQR
jgi:uncharacterized membrane protein YccC